MNRHVEALWFSRYTHAQWQLARKVAKTTAHADMRKQLSPALRDRERGARTGLKVSMKSALSLSS